MAKIMSPDDTPVVPSVEQPEQETALAEDPRLTKALEEQDKLQMYSDLLKGFQQIASAKSIGYGYKPDYIGSEILSEAAKKPVERYKFQLSREEIAKKTKMDQERLQREREQHEAQMDQFQATLAKSNIDLENEKENSTPGSRVSLLAAERVIQKQKELGKPVNEESIRAMSAKQLAPLFQYLQEDAMAVFREKQLKQREREIDERNKILREQIESREKQAGVAAAAKVKAAEAKVKEKEGAADAKEKIQIRKEDRKTRKELDSAESSLSDAIARLKDIKGQFEKYSKESPGGTGPLATAGGLSKYLNKKTELIDSEFKKVALDEMVKMFSGMSKAVDSEAERRAFQATQPSITLDDDTNRALLEQKIAAAENLLKKTKAAKQRYDKSGSFDLPLESDSVKMIDPNGVPRMVPKDQVEAAKAAGGKLAE